MLVTVKLSQSALNHELLTDTNTADRKVNNNTDVENRGRMGLIVHQNHLLSG